MNTAPFQLPAAALLLGGLCCLPARGVDFSSALFGGAAPVVPTLSGTVLTPLVVAGDPNGTFPGPDSIANRVDPNVPGSPYAGVVSLFMDAPGPGGFLCTGAVIAPMAVLTAGHCVDYDGDGLPNATPDTVTVIVNNAAIDTKIPAAAIHVHPDYTGFNNPSVNDDLTVVLLSQPVPAGTPVYPLLPAGSIDVTLDIFKGNFTGYGLTGDGIAGYTGGSGFYVKRTGANLVEAYDLDDEGSGAPELWYADFEKTVGDALPIGAPFEVYPGDPSTDALGALIPGWDFDLTLGNTVESNTGPGDSGGPLFVEALDGKLFLAGTTTFGADILNGNPGAFGSLLGGIWLETYNTWVRDTSLLIPEPSTYAAGAMAGALGFLTWRRQRRAAGC